MKKEEKRILILAVILVVIAVCLMSRFLLPQKAEPESVSGFAFDTTYTITVHSVKPGIDSKEVLQSCISKCGKYENLFSRTAKGSELYQINQISALYKTAVEQADESHKVKQKDIVKKIEELCPEENKLQWQILSNGSLVVDVSEKMYQLLEKGLYYSEQSEGAFDISIAPISSLWDFTSEVPEIPMDSALKSALKLVDYQALSLKNKEENQHGQLVFGEPGMQLDLGGIAKGFIADELKAYLLECGVTSGVISLGGNILCVGSKGDEDFKIGVQQPFADRNETVAVLGASDISVVSSGIYERYFEKDGKLYHHILNPESGLPFDNDLMAVTILSEKSVDGDGLSTACFAFGLKEGLRYINNLEGIYAMFITKDEKIWYSDGFEKFILEGED